MTQCEGDSRLVVITLAHPENCTGSSYRRLHKMPHPYDNICWDSKLYHTGVGYCVGGAVSYVTRVIKCTHRTPPTGGVIKRGWDNNGVR